MDIHMCGCVQAIRRCMCEYVFSVYIHICRFCCLFKRWILPMLFISFCFVSGRHTFIIFVYLFLKNNNNNNNIGAEVKVVVTQ